MAQARPSSFTFLNPEDIGPDSVAYADLEFDLTKAFNTPIRFAQRIGRIFTTIDVSALASPAHYYWRAKVRGSNADWTSGDVAFTSTPQQFFGQSDSLSWAVGLFSSVGFSSQNGVRLQKTKLTLHLISAGFLDGQFGVIELNGANVLPSSFARGHNIAVFDSITYAVVRLRTFDVFGNPAQSDSLAAFINDIPQGAIVAAIIIDDGGNNLSAAARTAYRSVGAAQAGKIGFRDSWGIVGRKGAEPGTVLETYRPASTGRVVLDTVFYRTESAGDVVTPSFGPSSRWKSLALLKETPSGALIQSTVIGNTSDGSSDTLLARDSARTINLSGISSHKYPELTLRFQFVSNTSLQSPALRSWNLAFDPPSELATSPALIRVSKQKVNEGESQDIAATIVNAGQVRADSVRINLLSDDKGSDLVLQSFLLDSIPAYDSVKVTYRYNSRGRSGTHHFSIDVDPDTLQTEFFRFNNRASVSYTVIPDTLQPILPNLAIIPEYISSPASLLTDDRDSYPIQILIANTGSVINDSIDVLVRHTFGTEVTDTRMFRIPMPVQFDTLTYIMTVKNRAGEHLISVTIDPQNKIAESNKADNNATKLFTVAATVIRLIQPVPSNAGLVSPLILLNPASEISDGVKSIQLQVDTLSDFSTAISRSTVMGQFTTSFDISALKHAARYWWHAKIAGGPKDWTVGSFYLGDSSGSLLGQIDSAGWSLSTFAHTGFTSTGGVKILNTPGEVNVVSAGYLDGNFASISINGVNRTTVLGDTCHLVMILDSSFSIMAVRRFHLFSNPADADSLTAFLQRLSSGAIIAAVICGEGSQNLTASVRDAYRSLGSIAIDRVGWRDAWAFIVKKGSAAITESYSPSGSGKAVADTTFFKTERSGSVTSPVIGPVSHWGVLSMKSSIPTGAQLTTMVIAVSSSGTPDTLRKSINVSTIDLQSLPAKQYSSLRFAFLLQAAPDGSSPLLRSWSVGSQTASELVLAASKVTLDKPVMQEGETCTLRATIFNVAGAAADSVRVLISSDDAGILRPVQDVTLSQLRGLDSALVTLQYDSRGKHGTHSFVLRVDPENRIPEFDKTNNTCTVSYTVIGDTLRPALDVTYDGMRVLDGDY
ncbi:MAG: hypothetical protein NTV54_00020, partial [Ignavibacteriales bacterium]|nr:hypothetical protein [Ignavibacteriales bacterium]